MTIEIKPVENKIDWDTTLKKFPYTTLFLTWEWAEFEKLLGNRFETHGVYVDGQLVGLLPIKYIDAKRGKYLHVRHAPLINWEDKKVVAKVTDFLKTTAKAAGYHFVRVSPLILTTYTNTNLLKTAGYRKSVIHSTDAELTVTIDLTNSLDKIFEQMKKTARNMIRKAEKLGLEVKRSVNMDLLEDFKLVYFDTLARNKWTAYNINYIKKELEIFQKAGNADIFVTYFNGEPVSSAIFIKHREQVIYHFGGSRSQFRHIPSSYLMHWEAIKHYKNLGLKIYNFWGVCPQNSLKHPWYGFSQFKRSFSNIELEHIHSHDLDVHPMAKLTHLYEFLESWLRGYR